MKIKDIRHFRTVYKEQIREIDSKNRNEHFVGVRTETDGKSQYGFFEIYHGDKEGFNESDGIRGFLEGFLDMAKDGQAVYEFMQNAVDAKSTNFFLFWGKDEIDGNTYLLVVNNGSMFNMDSIRSILNVGVSTKSSNNFTIGKFGIGFKLAHRLVGRENGLDELIYENYGPILFSWQNNEIQQLEKFIKEPTVIPIIQEYKIISEKGKRKGLIKTNEPWLFKILITNFPCLPENDITEEIIFDNQYNQTSKAFNKTELQALGRWVKSHSGYLGNDFKEGSLFFIRLGQGKQSHLEEENLEEGVKFSLAILNKIAKQSLNHEGLKTVNLRGKELKPVDLSFQSFIISKTYDKEQYRYLRFGKTDNLSDVELSKESADSDIEILLGFTEYKKAKDVFHNAPNFYLFFPLSEEKHKLRFILHSNAFYKAASRTFLQKGSVGEEGINERLFRIFIDKLKERMLLWVNSGDISYKTNYKELYANLLLSDASDNPERIWINEPLYEPILKFIQENIPVVNTQTNSFTISNEVDKIRIKNTSLPVDTELWLQDNTKWFVWDSSEIELSAEAVTKLKIKRFNIIDLLQTKEIALKLNQWLNQTNYSLVNNILNELNAQLIFTVKDELYWNNLGALKIWEFEDGFFSIDEIGNEVEYSKRLILFDTLDAIKEQLLKAGWKLSKKSLSEYINLWAPIQNRFQAVIKYIRRNEELIRVLNLKLSDANLTFSEKINVVKVLAKKLSDEREERISKLRELHLFRNQSGQITPLKALLKASSIGWLSSWVIHTDDYDISLDDYFISSPSDIYQNIILTYWNVIVNRQTSDTEIKSIFDYAKGVYAQNPNLNVLSDKEIVRVGGIFVSQLSPFFYSPSLTSFTELEYSFLYTVMEKINSPLLPSFDLLKYYEEPPFKIAAKPFNYDFLSTVSISLDEAKAFLKLCTKEKPEAIKSLSISQNSENEIVITPMAEGIHLVISDNILINNYIKTYHSESFVILPESLKEFGAAINLKDRELINRLTFECDIKNDKQVIDLIEIALKSDIDSRKCLVNKIPSIFFDIDSILTPDLLSVRFLKLLLSIDDETIYSENIKPKTSIKFNNEVIKLSDVHLIGCNNVTFEIGEQIYNLSLSSILINADTKASMIVSQLTNILSNIAIAEKTVLDNIFGLSGQIDKSIIAEQLKEKYNGKVLENCHQLAFVLHYSKLKPNTFSSEIFLIETKTENTILKDIVVYPSETNAKYIPQNLILHNKYEGIFKFLSIDNHLFKGSSGVIVCKSPYLDGNKVYLPGISNIDSSENQLLFIEFIFDNFKKGKEQLSSIYLENNKKWVEIIGFEPTLTIAGSELVLESERPPLFIQNWVEAAEHEINSNERSEFIKALGVSFRGSDVVRLRKFLLREESIMPSINYNLSDILVYNSLLFLEGRECQFLIGSYQIELLKELYNRLPEKYDLKEVPLPIISSKGISTIILSKVPDALFIEASAILQLAQLFYPINKLPQDAGKPVIYASLFRDLDKLRILFTAIQIEFDVLDINSIANQGIEWNRNFYNQWKALNPGYKIICYPGNIPHLLKISGVSVFGYNKNEIVFKDNTIIVNYEKNDKSIIATIEAKNYLPLNILLELKELFNKYDDSIQDFLNRIQSNQKLREEFEKLQQKEKIEQKKKELSDGIGNSEFYTMKWFTSLLELMEMSGGGNNLSNPQGNIIFGGLKFDPLDLRLLTFTNPSTIISPSIDLFTDFFATFNYLDENSIKRSKQIKISGVSKKGSELIVIPSNLTELNSINLYGVKEIELSFVRILDLLRKLTSAFSELNLDDDYNLKNELSENIYFIFGPPGTGKTTAISKNVIERIRKNDNTKILILTPTNKAADVLVKRILELSVEDDYPDGWLVRFGASADLELLDRGLIYDGNNFMFQLYHKCVFVTTIQRFPYEKVITNEGPEGEVKTRISDIAWDTIIFDEASMIMLPAIVFPLYKRKYKRYDEEELTEFIIGGDPLQIPPIYDISDSDLGEDNEGIKEENIYTMVGLQSFDNAIQADIPKYGKNFGDRIKNLETQYRSIESIGTIFSKFQYQGRLSHGRNENKGGTPNPRTLPIYFSNLGFKPITIIKYPVNTEDAIYTPQKLNNSPFHIYSAFLVNELILKFRKEVTESWNVGVISPYRPQANLLNRLLESHLDKSRLNIISDTVHGFQGAECDLVFAVFNPSSLKPQNSRFFKKEYIINVAVSRARDYLIILIPDLDEEMKKLPLFHSIQPQGLMNIIADLPNEYVANINAVDLEKKLMGKVNYFQENTFTNAHQSVNIYSDLFKNYIVKYSNTSIDVHIKAR
jgi:hypothetical protein